MTKNDTPIYLKVPKDIKKKYARLAKDNDTTMTDLFIAWITNMRVKDDKIE